MWGQIERFVKGSAKRATTLPMFIEALKPRLCCETINPKSMDMAAVGVLRFTAAEGPDVIEVAEPGEYREFLTSVLSVADQRAALDVLYRETAYVVLLVRDRLEREKPIEKRVERELEAS